MRRGDGGGCDHEPQGTEPSSGYREATVAAGCPTAAGPSAAGRRTRPVSLQKRAGGREVGRARLGRGTFYPRLIATTIDDRRHPESRAAASPAWIRHCPRASPRSDRRRESTRVFYVEEDIAARRRCRPSVAGEPTPASAGLTFSSRCGGGQISEPRCGKASVSEAVRRRRASRSARRRPALPASSERPASRGCSARDPEPW